MDLVRILTAKKRGKRREFLKSLKKKSFFFARIRRLISENCWKKESMLLRAIWQI
jgi:hypothetical protein